MRKKVVLVLVLAGCLVLAAVLWAPVSADLSGYPSFSMKAGFASGTARPLATLDIGNILDWILWGLGQLIDR